MNVTGILDETLSNLYHGYDDAIGPSIFFTIVYVVVLISGLIGNFIVLYVILKNNDLKHCTNYFFANLSAADVFVLIFCVPTAIHDIWAKDQWYMGKFFCLSNQYIESCVTSISSLTITAISFERFVAICEPFKVHEIFNETLTMVSMVIIWTVGLILSLPFLIFADYDSSFNPTDSVNNSSEYITVCQVNANSSAARAYITWFIIVLIFIPFFVLIFIYARIVVELIRHRSIRLATLAKGPTPEQENHTLNQRYLSNADQQQSHSFLSYQRFEQKRLNTVIICVVTVAFFACQFPVRIIQLTDMYGRVRNEAIMPHLAWIWIWKLSKLLFFLNFTANPIIYNLLSTKFRRSCQRLFQLERTLSVFSRTSRKGSVTSYLYSSIYKNRHRQSHGRTSQPSYPPQVVALKLNSTRSMMDSPSIASTIGNDSDNRRSNSLAQSDVPIGPTNINHGKTLKRFQQPFQAVNEEDEENLPQ